MQERCLDREAKASTELGGGELIRRLEGLQGAGSYTHLPALPPRDWLSVGISGWFGVWTVVGS